MASSARDAAELHEGMHTEKYTMLDDTRREAFDDNDSRMPRQRSMAAAFYATRLLLHLFCASVLPELLRLRRAVLSSIHSTAPACHRARDGSSALPIKAASCRHAFCHIQATGHAFIIHTARRHFLFFLPLPPRAPCTFTST